MCKDREQDEGSCGSCGSCGSYQSILCKERDYEQKTSSRAVGRIIDGKRNFWGGYWHLVHSSMK